MRGILLFALCALASTASLARGLTVDDLLGLESYGQVVLADKGRLLLVEHRRPYAEAGDFGYDTYFNQRIVTHILAAPIDRPSELAPLFPQSTDAGYWLAGLSPAQNKAAVFRLEHRRLSLGVVDLAAHSVQWLPAPPDMPGAAPGPVWIDDEHLAYVVMTRDRLPTSLLGGTAATRDLVDLWAAQGRGETTRTLVTTTTGLVEDDGMRHLVLASLADATQAVLATGDIVDLSLAPSHRKLAVVTAGIPAIPHPGAITAGFDSRRHHLQIFDLATHALSSVEPEILRGVLVWNSHDRLLVVTRESGGDWAQARWSVITPAGHAAALGGDTTYAAVEESGAGRLAAATSTGGYTNKPPGRVGDSPIVGAGTYALDGVCGVSGTGQGEAFIRHVLAHDVACRMAYRGDALDVAAAGVIADLTPTGTGAGLIALDAEGRVAAPFNTGGMYRGWVTPQGDAYVATHAEVFPLGRLGAA